MASSLSDRLPQLPSWSRLSAIALALALGGLGGWAASLLNLPLAWMIGAMLATSVASLAGAPIAMAAPLRTLMVAVLGVMLGSGFTPEILASAGAWAPSLAAIALYIGVCGLAGMAYFRWLCDYDPVTAYFSAMPGGLSEMVLVGTEMGGDGRVISLIHATRIMLVVLSIPFAFTLGGGLDLGDRPAIGPELLDLAAVDYAFLGISGMVGYVVARWLRVPAAAVVGPMVASALVHLAGMTTAKPPADIVACAQVAVGTALGARFAGTPLRLIGRTLVASLGVTALLVAITVVFALALHALTGLPTGPLVLAFAPGGLAEMSLIAIALGADAAFVAIHHIVRIFLIVVLAPLAFRLVGRRPKDGA